MNTPPYSEFAQWAIRYALDGHPILPVRGKAQDHDLIKSWKQDSTRSIRTILEWDALGIRGIALRCDRLCVFDLDGPEGRESFAKLQDQHGKLPHSRWARSGGGGYHILYSVPDEEDVNLTQSPERIGSLPKLDIRTQTKGIFVVQPTLHHRTGKPYQWHDYTAQIEPLPGNYIELLTMIFPPVNLDEVPTLKEGLRGTSYGIKAMQDELDPTVEVQEGDRNRYLNNVAGKLLRLAHGGQLDHDFLWSALEEYGQRLDLSPHEIRATLRSADRYAANRPRWPERK